VYFYPFDLAAGADLVGVDDFLATRGPGILKFYVFETN
jgi:hypothetical protein